ncbi:hypothetical protein FHS25_002983 [Rhizobium laguerreae]|uniref:Uncharacterized protein n=1 Tax=Rhizobium laguerreae TaxID=1076926 RepID=A0ABR6G8C6_9HYPH|nr:hypothetical protein [Rhizobium laguerreae]
MVARVSTVAFQGIEGVPVEVQVMVAPGKVGMQIVGLPDKAVAESRERVQAALHASGLALPAKRVTVNLAPADLPKEGSHFDLPIALALMAALGAIPADALSDFVVVGELNLDGTIAAISGALPAAIGANALGKGLICPAESGAEAAWAGSDVDILAPRSLIALANHFRGTQVLSRPEASIQANAAWRLRVAGFCWMSCATEAFQCLPRIIGGDLLPGGSLSRPHFIWLLPRVQQFGGVTMPDTEERHEAVRCRRTLPRCRSFRPRSRPGRTDDELVG